MPCTVCKCGRPKDCDMECCEECLRDKKEENESD